VIYNDVNQNRLGPLRIRVSFPGYRRLSRARKAIRRLSGAAAAAILVAVTGCAGPTLDPQPVKWQSVVVSGDTICNLKKRTWSIDDTPETVADAVAFNELWDRRCAASKGKTK